MIKKVGRVRRATTAVRHALLKREKKKELKWQIDEMQDEINRLERERKAHLREQERSLLCRKYVHLAKQHEEAAASIEMQLLWLYEIGLKRKLNQLKNLGKRSK